MKKTITLSALIFFLYAGLLNAQINSYPYVQTGDNPIGWNVIQGPILWYLATATNPAGVPGDVALVCNFYGQNPGVDGTVVSPAFNFTSLTRPVLHFHSAYKSYDNENDSLQVLISTNGGITFIDVPTPYRRSYNSTPSLATLNSAHPEFIPSAASQWRYETVDLTAYAGQNNILLGFRGVSAFGNNLWIDNFIVTNEDNYCQTNVSSAGNYSCSFATVSMTSIGLSPSVVKNNTIDNPSGGVLSFTEHINEYPVPSVAAVPIAPNSTATTHDGSVFTPNIIAPDYWYTISYTGDDKFGYANYTVSIDITNFISVLDPTKLYLVARADITGSWISLNTTFAGNSLTTSGSLSSFYDFAVAGDSTSNPLPVELASFTSVINKNNVTLNWKTNFETNNSGFEIQRAGSNGNWEKVSFVNGKGNSTINSSYSFTDKNLISGKYNYRLKQIDYNGSFEYYNLSNEIVVGIPEKFELSQNYPNPFNPTTKINFELPFEGKVSMKVFDMSGKEITTLINDIRAAGYYTVEFNASGLSSGTYFYRLSVNGNSGNAVATRKMMVVK